MLSRPIIESIARSQEDPIIDVKVTIIVFYSMNPILVDAERKLVGTLPAYHLLSHDGEA